MKPHKLRLVQSNEGADHKINKYCRLLDVPVPDLADMVVDGNLKLFQLMVLAILERGEPTTMDAIADRLASVGVESNTGDLPYSLQKAWHGSEPVYRDPEGRYALDLGSRELDYILLVSNLRLPKIAPPPQPPEPPPEKAPFEPLSSRELADAFKDATLYNVPISKQVAAVLEVHGPLLPLSEVDAILASLSKSRHSITLQNATKWRSPMLAVSRDGLMTLNPQAYELQDMRMAVRKLASTEVAKRLKNEYWAAVRVERQALVAKIEQKDATFADAVRRAVVYTHFENGRLLAASVLDCEQRSISVYIGGETSKLPDVLAQFGILAGLSVRELLHQFTLEPTSWRVVDLNSPQKTRRINKSGRTLRINAAMLITSSVGISRPLGDDDKMDEYLRNGDTAKLRRRLESNVKSLFAFYNYGRLHGCLRLRWGFLDENLSVSWSLPGDPSLYDVLKQSQESHAEIEFVTGSAPGWQAPWSRARRGVVVELDWHDVVLQVGSERQHFSRYDFQAIRFVGAQDAQPH